MESLLGLLGLLFLMFFVLAATVEAILEMFRGILEFSGITFLKGKYSLDDALRLANEFAPNNDALRLKLEAIKGAALQLKSKSKENIAILNTIQKEIEEAASIAPGEVAVRVNTIASQVRASLDSSESKRIFILRALSALIGCSIVYSADIQIFEMLSTAPSAPDFLKSLDDIWMNTLIGGFGAAAGSSYWHDKLDRIRNLKFAHQQITAFSR